MRLAIIGVSHWHAPLYYRPAQRLAGVEIVGVSDEDAGLAERVGRELETPSFLDYRELLETVRPEFVFAFGRHCDLPAIALALVDAGLPFLVEKPAGLNAAKVQTISDCARAKGLHAGTGFNFLVSDFVRKVQAITGEEPATHVSFRYIGGNPDRYRQAGCAWMLDPAQSGGGSTINLGVHFFDLFRLFSRSEPTEVAALMGNHTWCLPVEDYSAVVLRSERCVGTVETGYTYPAPTGVFDLRFSLRTARHYVVARSDDVVEIHRVDGQVEQLAIPTSNAVWYPAFVAESLDRFARGLGPVADLEALAAAMKVVDAAYASNRAGGATIQLAP